MSETEKKLLTVNEYAAENHVSRQSVNSKINRHKDELKGHVFIINGRKMLDGFAQDFLKPTKDNALLISKNAELQKSLENEKNVSNTYATRSDRFGTNHQNRACRTTIIAQRLHLAKDHQESGKKIDTLL